MIIIPVLFIILFVILLNIWLCALVTCCGLQETTEERMTQESPYMLFYQLQGLENHFDKFRAMSHGKRQELGRTDDDREFEETLKTLRKACVIQ